MVLCFGGSLRGSAMEWVEGAVHQGDGGLEEVAVPGVEWSGGKESVRELLSLHYGCQAKRACVPQLTPISWSSLQRGAATPPPSSPPSRVSRVNIDWLRLIPRSSWCSVNFFFLTSPVGAPLPGLPNIFTRDISFTLRSILGNFCVDPPLEGYLLHVSGRQLHLLGPLGLPHGPDRISIQKKYKQKKTTLRKKEKYSRNQLCESTAYLVSHIVQIKVLTQPDNNLKVHL